MNSAVHASVTPATGDGDASIWWDRKLFRSVDAAGGECPPVIDITGPSRHLVFGPYIAPGAGRWRARVKLELCPEAARRVLDLQFGVEPHYTVVPVPRVAGPQEIEIERDFQAGQLAEVRIWLRAPAFHGDLRFVGVELERVAE